ncbi:hypothetical protein AMST5_00982 [freshwater sediment metagenome]|uniref:Uncharacterized protein n=1 Tax=freshwater sediment metagenome TaxID=556182 RepID=A0AA48LXR9_9ZZZZ
MTVWLLWQEANITYVSSLPLRGKPRFPFPCQSQRFPGALSRVAGGLRMRPGNLAGAGIEGRRKGYGYAN